MIKHVLVVGSGNVAAFFLSVFSKSGLRLSNSSRNDTNTLARQYHAEFVSQQDLTNFKNVDLVILAVSDDAIELAAIPFYNSKAIVVHTSGATSIQVLAHAGIKNSGVVYPLQSISAHSLPAINQVPLMLETQEESVKVLFEKLGFEVHLVNSLERLKYHLAAVLVNNFSNHLFDIADEFLKTNQLSFNYLKPLIHQTVNKIDRLSPNQAQTGPALRNDSKTIQKHMDLIKENPQIMAIYTLFTNSIQNKIKI